MLYVILAVCFYRFKATGAIYGLNFTKKSGENQRFSLKSRVIETGRLSEVLYS